MERECLEQVPEVTHKGSKQCVKMLKAYKMEKQPEMLKLVIDLESNFASFSLDRQLNRRQVTMERFLSK